VGPATFAQHQRRAVSAPTNYSTSDVGSMDNGKPLWRKSRKRVTLGRPTPIKRANFLNLRLFHTIRCRSEGSTRRTYPSYHRSNYSLPSVHPPTCSELSIWLNRHRTGSATRHLRTQGTPDTWRGALDRSGRLVVKTVAQIVQQVCSVLRNGDEHAGSAL
jgi:hypothetical protein